MLDSQCRFSSRTRQSPLFLAGWKPRSLKSGLGILCTAIWLTGFVVTVPGEASAQILTIAETEALVRTLYYEGLPKEEAARIDEAGVARLIEMLEDPEEKEAHANILLVIGLCGGHGVLDSITAWAANMPEGELDRATFRAWQALPFALGHLAQHDPRALGRLEAQLSEASPRWTFRHHRGARLHRLQRSAAAMALGETGLPEAELVLLRAAENASEPDFMEHLEGARALHRERRIQRENQAGER